MNIDREIKDNSLLQSEYQCEEIRYHFTTLFHSNKCYVRIQTGPVGILVIPTNYDESTLTIEEGGDSSHDGTVTIGFV